MKEEMLASYNITSAGISAMEDRHRRIKIYFIMMAIRMACVISLIWVRGWWILLVALGAVFLPYLAVVIANEPDHRAAANVNKPDQLALESSESEDAKTAPPPRVIVVDSEENRPDQHGTDEGGTGATTDSNQTSATGENSTNDEKSSE